MPYLERGAIECKPVFKVLARELTHKVLRLAEAGTKLSVKHLAEEFFKKHPVIRSEEEAKRIVKKYRIK